MRKILFRGKCEDTGNWVYGFYTEDCVYHEGSVIENEDNDYCVSSKTIGEYTGLLDENGNELYEGDIVRAKFVHNGSVQKFVVVFDIGSFLFNNGFISVPLRDIVNIKIVGNIHDNPELLN